MTKSITYIWKTGFNGDHSKHNEDIVYHISDSTQEFFLSFPSHKTDSFLKLYDSAYEDELNNGTYKRVDDTIEAFMDSKAIVKNYQWKDILLKSIRLLQTTLLPLELLNR